MFYCVTVECTGCNGLIQNYANNINIAIQANTQFPFTMISERKYTSRLYILSHL